MNDDRPRDRSAPLSPTAEAIRAAAAGQFTRTGFAATTVRSIAADAGVNPALVIRHFGSKEALFLDVMRLPEAARGAARDRSTDVASSTGLPEVLQGPVASLGRRLVAYVVAESGAVDSPLRDVFVALARAAERPGVSDRLRDLTEEHFVAPIAARLAGTGVQVRARTVAVQLAGLMTALWVTGTLDVDRDGPEELVLVLGRALQVVIDEDDQS